MHHWIERLPETLATPDLGVVDCLVRIALGLPLTALAVDGTIGAWGLVLGVALLATGVTWICPVYRVLGITTASRRPRRFAATQPR